MKILAVLIVGCLLSVHAFAAAGPPPARRVKTATELLHVLNARKTSMAGAGAMIDAMIRTHPMMTPYRGVMMRWAGKYLSWSQIGPQLARLYAQAFTERQLRDLIRFYETPTGRKAVRVLPQLTRQGMMIGQRLARAHIGDLRRMIRARAAQLQKTSP